MKFNQIDHALENTYLKKYYKTKVIINLIYELRP